MASASTVASWRLGPRSRMLRLAGLVMTGFVAFLFPLSLISSGPISAAQALGPALQRGGPVQLSQLSTLSGHERSPHGLAPRTSSGCQGGGPGTQTFGNWADNEAVGTNCPRGVYRSATMQFYVPSINTSLSNAKLGIWTGVGGDESVTSSAVLVQAGVVITVVNGHQSNESFWEVVPGFAAQNLPLCRLNVGDEIYVDVESNVNNSGYDYFEIENETAMSHGFPTCYNTCRLDTTGTHPSQGACANVAGATRYNSDSASGECTIEQLWNSTFTTAFPLPQWTGKGPGEGTSTLTLRACYINTTAIGNQSHGYSNISENFVSCPCLTRVGPIVDVGQDFTTTWLAHG